MSELLSFRDRLLNLNHTNFTSFAIEVFQWQAEKNQLYKEYISYLKIDPRKVNRLEEIPFLPIEFFKNHIVKTGVWSHSLIFSSSGTTGASQSHHYLDDPIFYGQLTRRIFEEKFGSLSDFHIVALLPSYLERGGSSLVFMVDNFIKLTGSKLSGFFLKGGEELLKTIVVLQRSSRRKVIIGVTFALIDFATKHDLDLSDFVVMETGGMKGRGKELTREELHGLLKRKFNLGVVHSEYGMTELMSQAYSVKQGVFEAPVSMKVLIRDINDPFGYLAKNKIGGLNIIDMGNLHSCCFIETKDLGRIVDDRGRFEVLGRFDNSDLRGCNLLIQ